MSKINKAKQILKDKLFKEFVEKNINKLLNLYYEKGVFNETNDNNKIVLNALQNICNYVFTKRTIYGLNNPYRIEGLEILTPEQVNEIGFETIAKSDEYADYRSIITLFVNDYTAYTAAQVAERWTYN